MQNFLHEEKNTFFCKFYSLYTINNLCVVIEIIASYFPYGLKMMSRNTLSEPQPDSASYNVRCLKSQRHINWLSTLHQDFINPKPLELGSWNYERMFNPHHVSHVMCLMLGVRWQVPCVFFYFFYKVVKLVGGGPVINWAYTV